MEITDIYNLALTAQNLKRVSSITENEMAKSVGAIYDAVLDEALTAHPWTFATTIQQLSEPSGVTNYTAYDYLYQLPADPYFLQYQALMDSDGEEYRDQEYEIMRRYLYTDLESAYLKYTFRVDTPAEMTPDFGMYLAHLLAAKTANKNKQSDKLEANLYVTAEFYRKRAIQAENKIKFSKDSGASLWVNNR